ncbi:hypothetical protein OROHE_023343 [Orobanche hederae]
MMQTINPYASTRTAEIMSRYRPIAPKPESPSPNSMAEDENAAVPSGIRKSPYLRNVWAHLQARPTRTRKRGRNAAFAPPSSVKRGRPCLQGLISLPAYHATHSPAENMQAIHGFNQPASNFVPIKCCLDTAVATLAESVTLPLFCCTTPLPAAAQPPIRDKGRENGIDLNSTAAAVEELDLFPETVRPRVISPRPVRPVCSNILVGRISDDLRPQVMAGNEAEEVEVFVEAEKLPVIVSDSNNKVRMCNSAYKEMIGQPECGWLDCCAAAGGGGACRRIGGEISLEFSDSRVQMCMHGFSCRVKIEWESREGIRKCVNAYCDGVKLACRRSMDYQFLWRFNIAINEGLESG